MLLMHREQRLVQRAQELEAGSRDHIAVHPAIACIASALHQAALFELVNQPGHVGVALDQSIAQLAAVDALLASPAQDSQRVLLVERKIRRLEDRRLAARQDIRRAQQVEESLFLP